MVKSTMPKVSVKSRSRPGTDVDGEHGDGVGRGDDGAKEEGVDPGQTGRQVERGADKPGGGDDAGRASREMGARLARPPAVACATALATRPPAAQGMLARWAEVWAARRWELPACHRGAGP